MARLDENLIHCKACNKAVMHYRKGTSHLLHLLMTILTGGMWLIIWIGCAVKFGGWTCSSCGSKH